MSNELEERNNKQQYNNKFSTQSNVKQREKNFPGLRLESTNTFYETHLLYAN